MEFDKGLWRNMFEWSPKNKLAGHHEHCSFFTLLTLVNFFDRLKPKLLPYILNCPFNDGYS